MKSKFIKDYMVGERVNEVFLLTNKQLCISKTNKEYLSLKFVDKTGEIDGKKWETSESEFNNLEEGSFYLVKGLINEFNGLQIKVENLTKTHEECNPEDFMQCSPRDIDEMKKELKEFIDSIQDENCQKLIHYFFDDQKFYKKFCQCPAAITFHHNYVAGLLEHTLEVCEICSSYAKIYPYVKRDILIMGAILHDMG